VTNYKKMKLFVFSWNTQSVSYRNLESADFVPALGCKIRAVDPDLVIIGLQEDAIRDSELLAGESFINQELSPDYTFIKLVSLSGWGVTTYKALKNDWNYCPRGLRLAIFVKNGLEITKIDSTELVCPGIRDWVTAGKGGVMVSLDTNLGSVTFLNIHLPFSSRSIKLDSPERKEAVLWQAHCLRELCTAVETRCNPDTLIVFGDLNFRVQVRKETGAQEIAERIFSDPEYLKELVNEADELRLLFDYFRTQHDGPIFQEGIENQGPEFAPTCKLKSGRCGPLQHASYKLGHDNQRTPSWCDRILYRNNQGLMECLEYNHWEQGTMNRSDHAAVLGVFMLK
jgi:hypothetical protein